MLNRIATLTFAAAALASVALAAPAHASSNVSQESSPVWWGSQGDHADLVIYYPAGARGPLTVLAIYFVDVNGTALQQYTQSCGQANPDGTRTLNPGQFCWVRASRSPASVVARTVVADTTTSTSNINTNVRSSVEVRDVSDNVLTHIEVR